MEADDITPVPAIKGFDITEHKKQVFGMFVGEEERVSIQIDNSLIDAVMDKFGENVSLMDRGDGTAQLEISVQIRRIYKRDFMDRYGCKGLRDNIIYSGFYNYGSFMPYRDKRISESKILYFFRNRNCIGSSDHENRIFSCGKQDF